MFLGLLPKAPCMGMGTGIAEYTCGLPMPITREGWGCSSWPNSLFGGQIWCSWGICRPNLHKYMCGLWIRTISYKVASGFCRIKYYKSIGLPLQCHHPPSLTSLTLCSFYTSTHSLQQEKEGELKLISPCFAWPDMGSFRTQQHGYLCDWICTWYSCKRTTRTSPLKFSCVPPSNSGSNNDVEFSDNETDSSSELPLYDGSGMDIGDSLNLKLKALGPPQTTSTGSTADCQQLAKVFLDVPADTHLITLGM